jgi:hypothetical protein
MQPVPHGFSFSPQTTVSVRRRAGGGMRCARTMAGSTAQKMNLRMLNERKE